MGLSVFASFFSFCFGLLYMDVGLSLNKLSESMERRCCFLLSVIALIIFSGQKEDVDPFLFFV